MSLRFHEGQRVFVKEDENHKAVNRYGTVTRLCTDGERAWVSLDANSGRDEKVRAYSEDCEPSVGKPDIEPTIDLFGKDHWSTFAYIETHVVDHRGVPDKGHMRCHGDRHPMLVLAGQDGREHPTHLKNGVALAHHDDWDCLDDCQRENLVVNIGTAINPQYCMTERGLEIAARLRAHKAAGGSFGNFQV